MARAAITQKLVVHCEVKILTHIFKAETPKAYTYIGVSCRGCHAFFRSFNAVHGTRFTIKGSHSKSYWPWQFQPQPFAKSDEVLFRTYLSIANLWAESYSGYTVEGDPFAPDSEVQSGSRFNDGNEKARANAFID